MAAKVSSAVWNDVAEEASPARRKAVHFARVAWLAAEGFNADACSMRASALTLASTLALVPALAASFAYVRGLGWTGERLETLLLQRATILSAESVTTIVSWVDNISIAGLGLMGALFAIASAVSLLLQVESAFDAVWGHPHGRGSVRQAADALMLLVFAPVLIAVAASCQAALGSSSAVHWLESFGALEVMMRVGLSLLWYVLVCVAFTAVYMFVPAAPVGRRAALIGGIFAGVLWQLAQKLYVDFQFGLSGYNAIYGALAQVPILVFWMWTSWVVILAGAEIAAAYQNLTVCGRHCFPVIASTASRERLALAIAIELADAAFARRIAPTLTELSALMSMPVRTVSDVFGSLAHAGLVHTGGVEQRQCFLSLSPGSIAIERVIAAARGDERDEVLPRRPVVSRVVAKLAAARRAAFDGATLADLVDPRELQEQSVST